MMIVIKTKKWEKRVGGTADPQELLDKQAFKEYIDNIRIRVIFSTIRLFWTLSYEKK